MSIPLPDLEERTGIHQVIAGKARLSKQQALDIFHNAPLFTLGKWATQVANRIHGEKIRTYVIDRNINYTNVCSATCTFCAFKRKAGDHDAYTLDAEQIHQKIDQLLAIGGTQILLQGGMNPQLPLPYYTQLLSSIQTKYPQVHIHAFSPPEFVEFVAVLDIPGFPTTAAGKSHTLPEEIWLKKLDHILKTFKEAGLNSIPGGGAEMFAQHVRKRIGQGKATTEQWLTVMSQAHKIGLSTSATMMFGHLESIEDRIDHMLLFRDAQDTALQQHYPGKYHAFIAWPYQPENTPLGKLPQYDPESDEPFPGENLDHPLNGKMLRLAGATDYLRTQALSRLLLDNIHSIGSSWVTMGPHIGQTALAFGASDMGSVMMEENVVSSAGTTYALNEQLICHLIRDAGFIPAQRDNDYNILQTHDTDRAPDLQVKDWSTMRIKALHHQTDAPSSCHESQEAVEPTALTIEGQ